MAGYKLMRICPSGLYRDFHERLFRDRKMRTLPYEQALQHFRDRGYLYPGGFRDCMKSLGNEVFEIIADFPPMQALWAKEHGHHFKPKDQNASRELIFSQISAFRPDVIYFQYFDLLPYAVRKNLKSDFPFVKIITGFKGFPAADYSQYRDIDFIFIGFVSFMPHWRKAGIKTYLLYHCYDPAVLEKNPAGANARREWDFIFIGSTGFGNTGQTGRYFDLLELMKKTNLNVWGLELKTGGKMKAKRKMLKLISRFNARLLKTLLTLSGSDKNAAARLFRDALLVKNGSMTAEAWYDNHKPLSELFPDRFHQPLFGDEYLSQIARSRIVLNRHIDETNAVGNIRLFEVPGAGACLLTDMRPKLFDIFNEDEIVTYESLDECVEKVEYLLSHERERAQTARKGNARVMRDHTVKNRCAAVDETIEKHLRLLP